MILFTVFLYSCNDEQSHDLESQYHDQEEQVHKQQVHDWYEADNEYKFSSLSKQDDGKKITYTVVYDEDGNAEISKEVEDANVDDKASFNVFVNPDNFQFEEDDNKVKFFNNANDNFSQIALPFDTGDEIEYHQLNEDDPTESTITCSCQTISPGCEGDDGCETSHHRAGNGDLTTTCVPQECCISCGNPQVEGLDFDDEPILEQNFLVVEVKSYDFVE